MKTSKMTLDMHGQCRQDAVVQGEKWRITVLTEELLRLEYSEEGIFEDRATQRVMDRNFPAVAFEVKESDEELELVTEKLHLFYDKQSFSGNGLQIQIRGNGISGTWHYGDETRDLKGTARTLDEAAGPIPLEHGLLSFWGFTVLDDSGSLALPEEGWIAPRSQEAKDLYFFGYGHAYERCLKDFYHLCGKMPLVPRFVLGNWWSRYYRYTEAEYKALIEKFEEEKIPLSVAVIDMDWHLVDIDPKYGNGWTGFTWNRELFPDPKEFMEWLHAHGLKVSLNVHPADGVRGYEEPYQEMAQALGRDWEKEEPIPFDMTDPEFVDASFTYLYHPQEEDGVDFWWLDWQQGGVTKVPGLDPLWMLNHYHFLDSMRDGKRGLTFSRYAGVGSHRYPIGFSGDTHMRWEALDFQPYFTATASNVGYGWWSHDIGGHMLGYKDEELITRWVQFGVFSPILRLHSSSSDFMHKEPWFFNETSHAVMRRYLRLRHALIPYLYTMNYHAGHDGQPLIRPMYYTAPECWEAYEVPNEYWFGTELVACPITKPMDQTGFAPVRAWLPDGTWFDIFNGRKYEGNRKITMYRELSDIPVLAKAGGIVPMTGEDVLNDGTDNPAELTVKIFAGADGSFCMYEDQGNVAEDRPENWARTQFVLDWTNRSFSICSAEGNLSVIPRKRSWKLEFYGITEPDTASVTVDGAETGAKMSYDARKHVYTVLVSDVDCRAAVGIAFGGCPVCAENDLEAQMYDVLTRVNMQNAPKDRIMKGVRAKKGTKALLSDLQNMDLGEAVYGILSEVVLA